MLNSYSFASAEHIRREKQKMREAKKSRWWLEKKNAGICFYCKQKYPPTELTMDHVVPIARGGTTSAGNIVPCCRACNQKKGVDTPVDLFFQTETASHSIAPSPLEAQKVASQALSWGDLGVGTQGLYWTEGRPTAGGRATLVHYSWRDESFCDVSAPEQNISTSVHGYGGGAFAVLKERLCWSDAQGGVYTRTSTEEVRTLVSAGGDFRYGSFCISTCGQKVYALKKSLQRESLQVICWNLSTPIDAPIEASEGACKEHIIAQGYDFYSDISISPCGKKLCWLQWNHPHMPWDENELVVVDLDEQGIPIEEESAGQRFLKPQTSFYNPQWSPAGELYVAWDISGYWNIFLLGEQGFRSLCPMEADFGRPLWIAGVKSFGFLSSEMLVVSYCVQGIWHLGTLSREGVFCPWETGLTSISNLVVHPKGVFVCGGSGKIPPSLFFASLDDVQKKQTPQVVRRSLGEDILEERDISLPQPISFVARDGEVAHGFYYAPSAPMASQKEGAAPPLIVRLHGGPTVQAEAILNFKVQYYTSRGFAYVEVNYRGSAGFGRAYREKLKGKWGQLEVGDALDCAQYLCEEGLADPRRLLVSGSSAGGFSALCAIATSRVFCGASVCYGISDLAALAGQIHKFEAYYDEGLLGGHGEELYKSRSPLSAVERMVCPLILFHGDRDGVVPASQSQVLYEMLKAHGVECEYILFADEGHGFKKAATIIEQLQREEAFFMRAIYEAAPAF